MNILNSEIKIDLYKKLLLPRLIEEKMLILLRQGRISKWFSGIGQEAISVGCTAAMDFDETIFTMHRNLGVFTTREIPLSRLFSQWEGKMNGFTKGRDRSFHFGTNEYNIVGMISHLGPQLSLAGGVAFAHKLRKEKKLSLAFTGEGGTSQGEFHEALNVASVWKLPVIFVIENNGYGLSTPINEQYACKHLSDRAVGYGMQSSRIDGNDIETVYQEIKRISEIIKNDPQPWLLECDTFRMRGHEEASGIKYVPKELLEEWAKKDPIANYEMRLVNEGVLSKSEIEEMHRQTKAYIEHELNVAFDEEDLSPSVEDEVNDIYMPYPFTQLESNEAVAEKRLIDAIADGLDVAMSRHSELVMMGQDIAEYGGVFKATEGLVEKYGKSRVRNTPLCESAILGIAMGLSIKGIKSMVEMQFSDFVTCGFNQIVNNLAKMYYRWGQNADVVIRMPTGGTVGAGPFHSQSTEVWFAHVPGLKIAYPSNAYDAKGLLLQSFEDPNPVMFYEHKALYRQNSELVPEGYYNLEFGKANIVKEGNRLTIVTYGLGVSWAMKLSETIEGLEIIDLRTLVPLDMETVLSSVKKTSRALVLHEDNMFAGIGAEIVAEINEKVFEYLDAPATRVAGLDTPIPFSKILESQYMANARLKLEVEKLLNY